MLRPVVLALLLAGPAAAQDTDVPPAPTAFLGLHWLDTSTEGAINGVRADETARLAMATAHVADAFAARGFALVDIAPVQPQLDRTSNPAQCNGCDLVMGKALGADYVLVGEVQKVSNLILSMNLSLRDVASGRAIRAASVDIRGNTDESWQRGLSYLMRNRIFRDTTGGKTTP